MSMIVAIPETTEDGLENALGSAVDDIFMRAEVAKVVLVFEGRRIVAGHDSESGATEAIVETIDPEGNIHHRLWIAEEEIEDPQDLLLRLEHFEADGVDEARAIVDPTQNWEKPLSLHVRTSRGYRPGDILAKVHGTSGQYVKISAGEVDKFSRDTGVVSGLVGQLAVHTNYRHKN
jgi:hypothetical protein